MDSNNGAVHNTCHGNCFFCSWPPIYGVQCRERAQLVSMVWVFFRITRIIFWTVKVHLWIICGDSWIPLIVCIFAWSSGMGWILIWGFLSWPIGWLRAWSAVILWIGWWASIRGRSLMWGVMAKAVCISVWMLLVWTTPVMSPVVSLGDLECALEDLWWLWLWYLWWCDCDQDLLLLCLSVGQWHKAELLWCLCQDCDLWWHAGVPEGGILCR